MNANNNTDIDVDAVWLEMNRVTPDLGAPAPVPATTRADGGGAHDPTKSKSSALLLRSGVIAGHGDSIERFYRKLSSSANDRTFL